MTKILLIEDEPLLQKALKKLLEKKGATVSVAGCGKEAIELIQKGEFDRIVCDLMLQDITGFDIIEESKRKYSSQELSRIFIIMTAYGSKQVLDKAAGYGCQILQKPFEDIGKAIEIILER